MKQKYQVNLKSKTEPIDVYLIDQKGFSDNISSEESLPGASVELIKENAKENNEQSSNKLACSKTGNKMFCSKLNRSKININFI